MLLEKATDLGERLGKAFATPSGDPNRFTANPYRLRLALTLALTLTRPALHDHLARLGSARHPGLDGRQPAAGRGGHPDRNPNPNPNPDPNPNPNP